MLACYKSRDYHTLMMISATYDKLLDFEALFFRFDLSGKCNSEAMKEEMEEKRRTQVLILAIIVDYVLSNLQWIYNAYWLFITVGDSKTPCYIASISSKKNEDWCWADAASKERDHTVCYNDWPSEEFPGSLS